MKARWIISAFCVILAAGAGYLSWLLGQAGDDGRWLFLVFAAFFLILSIASLRPVGRRPAGPNRPASIRFVASWVLPFYLLLFGGLLILSILVGIFHTHGR